MAVDTIIQKKKFRKKASNGGRPLFQGVKRTSSGRITEAGRASAETIPFSILKGEYEIELEECQGNKRMAALRCGNKFGPRNGVYFIRAGKSQTFKIGSATNGELRLAALQTANPFKLEMCAYLNYTTREKAFASEMFARTLAIQSGALKLRGEWVDATDQIINSVFERLLERDDGIIGAKIDLES